MKTFNLKSISWTLIACAMMCMFAFAGCSDDDEQEKIENNIPELKEEIHTVGDEITISFTANADWILSSNASWCKFANGDFAETTMSGKAGEQTVKVKISDEGQDYLNDNTAVIKLKIGAEAEKEIYKATRLKKVFTGLVIKSVPGEDETEVVYDAENPIVIKGCNAYGVGEALLIQTSITEAGLTAGIEEGDNPDWITISNKDENFSLTFNQDNTDKLDPKYSFGTDKGYTIKFSVKKNNTLFATAEIPVVYEGLKEGELLVAPQYANVRVSENGKKIKNTDANNSTITYQDKIETVITTRNDEFEIITFEQIGEFMEIPGMGSFYMAEGYVFGEKANTSWVHVAKEGTKCTVTFDAYVASEDYTNRGAVVMALPKVVYDKIKDNLEEEIAGDGYISPKYASYVIAASVQTVDEQISFATNIKMDGGLMAVSMMIGEDCTNKYTGEPIQGAGTDNIYLSNTPDTYFMYSEDGKIYYEIKDGEEGMTIESEAFDKITVELAKINGKDYIVLSPEDANNIPLQKKQIVVKSADNSILALLILEIVKGEF